jgi:hypothetical protein
MKSFETTLPKMGTSPRRAAIVAGIASLLMAVVAGFAEMNVRQTLIVPGDAIRTATQVQGNASLFLVGILGLLGVVILDLVVTWAFFVYFRSFSKQGSWVAAVLRFVYSVAFGIVQVNLWLGYRLLSVQGNISAPDAGKAMDYFSAYETGWAACLIVFGLHLVVVGWMGVRLHALPKWLGLVLLMAGIAYGVDNAAKLLWTGYADYKPTFTAVVALFSIVGEVGLALWLLIKGGKAAASK